MTEMHKTPEEIKKGLKNCCNFTYACNDCPYDEFSGFSCKVYRNSDAYAYIQQLEAQVPKWISVEERLPEDLNERVLVCIEDGNCIIGSPAEDTDRFDPIRRHWVRYGDMVTHWMPLPEPPKEES